MDDLKLIKTHYGEQMMHLCRELFPTLLETPGLLFNILSSSFAYSRTLYADLIKYNAVDDFKEYIYSLLEIKEEKINRSTKTPQELLDEAGYILYECHSEEDIQSFKKYYAPNEELCTFKGGRLNRCHVFFVIKKNVDEIKRENFKHPKREDEYGTSVMSIQFTRGNTNTISIKNRYNHTVINPDSTYLNNLDNIIEGLTSAFEQAYGFHTKSTKTKFELKRYVKAGDGKYYKYNFEYGNTYYCPNNIIIDNFAVKQFDKSRYLVFEYFILDMQEKKIYQYNDNGPVDHDDFIEGLQNIKKIEVLNENENKKIIINDDIIIILNSNNQIISYTNTHLEVINDNFLTECRKIKEINIPNVTIIGDNFLFWAKSLEKIDLPKVKTIGNSFIIQAKKMKEINLPNVKHIGNSFMNKNVIDSEVNIILPNVETIGNDFLMFTQKSGTLNLPKLKSVGNGFLRWGQIDSLNLPSLESVGNYFISDGGKSIKTISLPKLKSIPDDFLTHNEEIITLYMPNVTSIGDYFLTNNIKLQKIDIPNVEKIGNSFLLKNREINEINLPNVIAIGNNFLSSVDKISAIDLPNVITIGSNFLQRARNIIMVNVPKLVFADKGFLGWVGNNVNINAPNYHGHIGSK